MLRYFSKNKRAHSKRLASRIRNPWGNGEVDGRVERLGRQVLP